MHLLYWMMLVLFVCPLGKMFVLHPLPEEPSSPAIKTSRLRGELEIRKILLESLNLQQEPRVSVSGMTRLRDQWKTTFKTTIHSRPVAANATFPEDTRNSTDQCCKHTSQVFIKDLGWSNWVVYPESFTFTRCQTCNWHHSEAQSQCCKPTAHDFIPFLYVDEWSALVLSSVRLIRECGCNPEEDKHEVMTPS